MLTSAAPPPDITEQPITVGNWYQHVNWLNTTFIIFIPLIGLVSSYWIDLQFKTAVFAVLYYFWAGLGISKSHLAISGGSIKMADTSLQPLATTASGPTRATRLPSRSRSSWPPVAPPPSRAAPAGGPACTAPTTATPTPRRTPTRSARACSTATSAGWS